MQQIQADVRDIKSLSSFVYQVILQPSAPVDFKAGQYLHVVMGDEDKRPFSIASSPQHADTIELHIGASPDNPYAYEVITKVREEMSLQIEVGIGQAFMRESDKAAVLIAGGTGFSYTRSILLQMLKQQPERQVTLYWGAKKEEDLYLHDELVSLCSVHDNFKYVPVVENVDDWQGKTGLVHLAVLDDIEDMSDVEVYVAGRFEMAGVIRDAFLPKGLPKDQLFGDAYAFI